MIYIKSHEEYAISPLTISPNHNAWPSRILKKMLAGKMVGEKTFCIHRDGGLEFFADYDAWNNGSDYLLNLIKKDKYLVKFVSEQSTLIYKQLLDKIGDFEKKTSNNFTNKQLSNYLNITYKLANDLCAYGYVPVLSDHYFLKFSNLLKDIVKIKNQNQKAYFTDQETLSILCSHTKNLPSKLARIKLLKLIKQNKNSTVKLEKYYRDWYWINFGQLGPAQSLNNFLVDSQKLIKNKKSTTKELDYLLRYETKLKKQQLNLVKILKLTKEERYLFAVSREFTFLKGLRMEILFGVCATWSKVLDEISKRLEINKNLLYYSSVKELVSVLTGKNFLNKKELLARSKFCVWIADKENLQTILSGKEAKSFLNKIKFKELAEIKNVLSVHGSVASKGYVVGTVKIVNKVSEIDKVKKGDILVSVATHPGLLPAMNKAVAFVTDSGGITSHAAIVAREMNKPCIIGTKVASKIFKDGDMVEVDAKKGVVRKV